jgi:hypothetical protein
MRAFPCLLVGVLAAAGAFAILVLGRHPIARYAFDQAVAQDVSALARVLWH